MPQEKVPALGARAFLQIGDKTLALFNVAAQFYAIDDSCPHQGASLFGGKLEGQVIQCCAHGLRFDLVSGYLLNSTQLKVASYPVEVIDDQVFIVMKQGE
ncbi:Rieske (2Fe-2S) protein [Acinetobacter silvestris]|uniref:Rieske (2Fe-2S) protein n=1 Tax=Acinetobacter silvestris TaxID=1977882 RepID=UPI000A3400A4|nr:Rieske 2Fe-2S domain-containing protein [Acinetobacter silvestris]